MPREFRSFRVEAIVLYHADSGEADRVVTLYTRQEGKVRTVAKGVRKIRSRKAGHLEPFTHVTVQLAKSRSYPLITQAETIEAFLPLRQNLERVGQASYVVELLDKFTYEEGENISLFTLLRDTFHRLIQPDIDPALITRYYELRLLDFVGFRPELYTCVICGEEIQAENQYFSAEHGGAVCPNCGHGQEGMRPISLDALRYLRFFQRSTYAQATKAQPNANQHREMELIMQHYITYVLERSLKTPRFIRDTKGSYPTPPDQT